MKIFNNIATTIVVAKRALPKKFLACLKYLNNTNFVLGHQSKLHKAFIIHYIYVQVAKQLIDVKIVVPFVV